jgi:hypothetical protein
MVLVDVEAMMNDLVVNQDPSVLQMHSAISRLSLSLKSRG